MNDDKKYTILHYLIQKIDHHLTHSGHLLDNQNHPLFTLDQAIQAIQNNNLTLPKSLLPKSEQTL